MQKICRIFVVSFLAVSVAHGEETIVQDHFNEEVSANEDLMREHGVLNRLLLIYQEIASRIDAKKELPKDILMRSAKLVRNFLENYHEKIEEEFIFPRFEKAQQMLDLVAILKDQHNVGRKLTDYILVHADDVVNLDEGKRKLLSEYLKYYVRMFRPHEAREDTILFPAFHKLITEEEYDKLGDRFEQIEQQHFGEDGFEKAVEQVAEIEKQLGIYNLSQFTPELSQ
jgi:hemerythrin-like domain-containing protein